MASRFLIYSTGTTYAETIVRESATDNPGAFEKSFYTNFVIPEIQPLYLWRVTGATSSEEVIPNTDANINAYLEAVAPPPQPEDDATVGFVTGITENKIDTVTGATGNLGTFNASGNLDDAGLTIAQLTGLTTYTFTGSGGTTVQTNGNAITITSTVPTGTTVAWGDISGDISNQTDLWNILTTMTGETANKLDTSVFNTYTGDTETRLETIESDITGLTANKLDANIFTGYTATTQPILDSALTGATSLGSGTTLVSTSGRNVTVKSISVLGGLSISGDANNLILSGGSSGGGTWGSITGTLSDQTDLWNTLTGMTADTANKLDTVVFTGYTASTETRLETIESDITGLTANKLDASIFNSYTGTTQPVIDAALTGATNGLTAVGRDVELGGALTKDTLISGLTNTLTINTGGITLQSADVAGIDLIDAGGGGIVIESDGGQIDIIGNTSGETPVNKISISELLMSVTDGRAIPVGLEYVADYSATFTPESLITKRYADAIVQGLDLKESVKVASTTGETDIDLTGGTFGGTLDGYTVQDGDRVLIKNQDSNKEQNGIYVYSSGGNTFARAIDFVNPLVTAGAFTFVETGTVNGSSGWVLVTQDPINIGTTQLDFTRFSESSDYSGGVGIDISGTVISVDGATLAGNSISWTGNTFNVDISSGTLSTALDSKLNVSDFNTYSGNTDIRIDNLETGLTTVENQVTGLTVLFTGYTASTETRLETIESDITGLTATTAGKLDTDIFTGYTASTAANEIFLIHSGGTELNVIIPTAIEWDAEGVTGATGAAYNWTGSSEIEILESDLYEINYNIPYNISSNSSIGVGANLILNGAVIDVTAAAGLATRNAGAASIGLPPVVLSLTTGDVLNLVTFRTHQAGSATSSLTGSILIKKKNTLQ